MFLRTGDQRVHLINVLLITSSWGQLASGLFLWCRSDMTSRFTASSYGYDFLVPTQLMHHHTA